MIKRYFFTGLALVLPVVVTIWIMIFLVNLFTKPFENFVVGILSYYEPLQMPILMQLISKFLILCTLIGLTIGVGLFTRVVFAHYFIRFGDYVIDRIPIINRIYKAAQDVVKTILANDTHSFKRVVLVPFPNKESYSFGMVTSEFSPENTAFQSRGMVSVFVPGTPNPTMGFLLIFHRDQLIFVDLPVDEAIKNIMSCGITITEIHKQIEQKQSNESNLQT